MIDIKTAEKLKKICCKYCLEIEFERNWDDVINFKIAGAGALSDMFLNKLALIDDLQSIEPQTQ